MKIDDLMEFTQLRTRISIICQGLMTLWIN